MREYEIALVFNVDYPDEEHIQVVEKVKSFIEQRGGKVISEDDWGVRELAYPIKKKSHGRYYFVQFDSPPDAAYDLQDHLRYTPQLLRMMIVRREC